MGTIGFPEMLMIFFIIVLLFGARKLPELARGLGKGLREFKQATKEPDEIEKSDSKVESDKEQ